MPPAKKQSKPARKASKPAAKAAPAKQVAPPPVVEKVAEATTSDAVDEPQVDELGERFTEFLAKIQNIAAQMSALKTEFRALEKTAARRCHTPGTAPQQCSLNSAKRALGDRRERRCRNRTTVPVNGLQFINNGQRRSQDGRPRPADQQDGQQRREEEGRARDQDWGVIPDGAQARGRAEDRLRAARR